MAESIEQLGFELTAGALAEQERAVAGLRVRAGTVLAAASVAGSFFSARTTHGALGVLAVLGMLSFASCMGSAIWVLLPHAFVFAFSGEAVLATSKHLEASAVMEAYRTVSIWIEPHLEVNGEKISSLSQWLAVSCALLASEIILWTLTLIG